MSAAPAKIWNFIIRILLICFFKFPSNKTFTFLWEIQIQMKYNIYQNLFSKIMSKLLNIKCPNINLPWLLQASFPNINKTTHQDLKVIYQQGYWLWMLSTLVYDLQQIAHHNLITLNECDIKKKYSHISSKWFSIKKANAIEWKKYQEPAKIRGQSR